MIDSVSMCKIVEILNTRIINASTIRNKYANFSDDYDHKMYCKWDGIIDELYKIRDEFEGLK